MIKIDGISQPVEIVRSNRKSLGIQIEPEGYVLVRAPLQANEKDIIDVIVSKKKWIEEHIVMIAERKKQLDAEPTEKFTMEEIHAMAEKAVKLIPERVRYYAPLLGVTYGKITIRNQKSRWGSCSSKGNL
ncbi:MAG: M48 family metallopeptidase, partial [Treponema sp.]|nr:M48 family metallopeptidase [Treponema sp.]